MPDQFPVFRLVTLLARQLSAPIAANIKQYARAHPRFSRCACMSTGRAYHACELRFRMWALALRQPRAVPPISDLTALDSGANILGEITLFGIGGLIVIFEVNRQANKQEDKVLDEASQWLALLVSLEELQHELVLQQQDIDRLQTKLRHLAPQLFPHTNPFLLGPSPQMSESPEQPNSSSPPSSPSPAPKLSSPTSPSSIPPPPSC